MTGAAGFIGSHLVDKLLAEGHMVFGIDDLSGGSLENVSPRCQFEKIDLQDKIATARAIEWMKPEVVYHLAANAAENKAQFSPIDITNRNVGVFLNTLVPAIKTGSLKRVVFTSSIAVYGALQTPFKETDKPEPEDIYGISKLACEQMLRVLSFVHGFEYVIARPHNVYGPRQNMRDPYRNVVAIFGNKLLKGEPYYIYGDGNQVRCFSYIDDVVKALVACLKPSVAGMTFNIGSDARYTINELSEALQEVAGHNDVPEYVADRPQEVKEAISDHSEAKKYLGYKDETSLKKGLEETWLWMMDKGPQELVYDELEIPSDKIPVTWKERKI